MAKGPSSTTIGYRYYFTIHMGLSRGRIDEIVQIKIGDKRAWPQPEGSDVSDIQILDDRNTAIKAPNLFGGDRKEGGVEGSLTVRMGKADQIFPEWVKTLMGGSVPDFRGVVSVIFDGMICALNPYPKPWKFRVRRSTRGWDGSVWEPDLVTIWLADDNIQAMNPAHIIYECATNRDWGAARKRSRINEDAFLAAAQTLYDEGFGLCMRWNRQENLDVFVQSVLDHIGGALYTDRETGLLTLKLIRGDYDPDELPLYTYENGLVFIEEEAISREGDINEIIVNYINPLRRDPRSIRAQNLASIQSLGARNAVTVEYPGLPTGTLAARVAARDLKAGSSSLRRYKIEFDRRAWTINPGDVIRVSAPDKNIENAVIRIGKFHDGTLKEGKISAEAVLDVFGLNTVAFVEEQESEWVPPDTSSYPVTIRKVREATYFELVNALSEPDLAEVAEDAGAIIAAACRPSQTSLGFNFFSRIGAADFEQRGEGSWNAAIELTADIDHYETTITFDSPIDIGLAAVGFLLEVDDELMKVVDIDMASDNLSGTMTVLRGCIDTIPAPHTDGTRAFFVDDGIGMDHREYVLGESVDVKLQTITSSSELPLSLAPTDNIDIVARQGKPYPPGRVRVNDIPCFDEIVVTNDCLFEWKHRDRLLQLDQIVHHEGGNVGPEPGVTYTIRIYSDLGALLHTQAGILTNSWLLGAQLPGISGDLVAQVESKRGSIVSFQTYEFEFQRTVILPLSLSAFSVPTRALGRAVLSFTTAADPNVTDVRIYRVATGTPFDPMTATLLSTVSVAASTPYTYTDGDASIANGLTNPGFTTGAAWTLGTDWTIGSSKASKAPGTGSNLSQTLALTPGVYRGEITILDYVAGSITPSLTGGTTVSGSAKSGNGSHLFTLTALSGNTALAYVANSAANLSVDSAFFYRETGTAAPQGVWDYYAVPVDANGYVGATSGPATAIVI